MRWSGQNMCYCRFSFHCTLQKWDKDFLDLDELNPMVWVPSIFRRMIDFSLAVFKLRALRAVHPYVQGHRNVDYMDATFAFLSYLKLLARGYAKSPFSV